MKLSKNAKAKWFYKHIASYEIYWRDKVKNKRYVTYNGLETETWGFSKRTSDVDNAEIALFEKEIYFLNPVEIFFRYRRFARRGHNENNIFVMDYTKYAKEVR